MHHMLSYSYRHVCAGHAKVTVRHLPHAKVTVRHLPHAKVTVRGMRAPHDVRHLPHVLPT